MADRSASTERARRATGLAVAIFAVAFGTNVPTALLLRYRELLDLSPTVVTIVFATYAAGLVPALLLAGPFSDRRGRRTAVLPFVVVAGVASVVLLVGATETLAALLAGRFLQGVVSGVVFSVGSAWLTELVDDPGAASRRASAAMSLGFSLGPLTAGFLGQYAPLPDRLSYLLHLAFVVVAVALVARAPETVVRRPGRGRWVNLGVPAGARPAFLAFVLPTALLVFTFPSIAATVLPLGLEPAMPGLELVATGLVAGVTLGVGVLVQPLAGRLGIAVAAPVGAGAGALGLVLGAVALSSGRPLLLAPVAVLLGAGYGLSLPAGLTATQQLADPAHRGALTSTYLALTYLGFGAPVVLTAVSDGLDFLPAALALAGLAALATAWLSVGPGARLVAARHAETEAAIAASAPGRPAAGTAPQGGEAPRR